MLKKSMNKQASINSKEQTAKHGTVWQLVSKTRDSPPVGRWQDLLAASLVRWVVASMVMVMVSSTCRSVPGTCVTGRLQPRQCCLNVPISLSKHIVKAGRGPWSANAGRRGSGWPRLFEWFYTRALPLVVDMWWSVSIIMLAVKTKSVHH